MCYLLCDVSYTEFWAGIERCTILLHKIYHTHHCHETHFQFLFTSKYNIRFQWISETCKMFCVFIQIETQNEPRHDKTNKGAVRPAKTQISLGIHPVWSESSLSAWRKLGSLVTDWAHSKDSDQTGRMPRLIWVFVGRTVTLLVLSCCGSNQECPLAGNSYFWRIVSITNPKQIWHLNRLLKLSKHLESVVLSHTNVFRRCRQNDSADTNETALIWVYSLSIQVHPNT